MGKSNQMVQAATMRAEIGRIIDCHDKCVCAQSRRSVFDVIGSKGISGNLRLTRIARLPAVSSTIKSVLLKP
jgi:hypothetical protein